MSPAGSRGLRVSRARARRAVRPCSAGRRGKGTDTDTARATASRRVAHPAAEASTASVDAAAAVGPTGNAEFAVRNFGGWVDDAYVLPRGEAWVGFGAGFWRLPFANQVDAPMVSASIGVATGCTSPPPCLSRPFATRMASAHNGSATCTSSGKIGLRDPTRGFGVAAAPLLEVLSDGSWPSADGGTDRPCPLGRAGHSRIPRHRLAHLRQRRATSRAAPSSAAARSTSRWDTRRRPRPAQPQLLDSRPAGGPRSGRAPRPHRCERRFHVLPRPSISLYALTGRTLSQIDDYASRFFLSGGVSIRSRSRRRRRRSGLALAAGGWRRRARSATLQA